MKRIVTIEDSTGNVVSQWSGGDEQNLGPVAGRTHITLDKRDEADYSGQRWNGKTFTLQPASTTEDQLSRIETKLDAALAKA